MTDIFVAVNKLAPPVLLSAQQPQAIPYAHYDRRRIVPLQLSPEQEAALLNLSPDLACITIALDEHDNLVVMATIKNSSITVRTEQVYTVLQGILTAIANMLPVSFTGLIGTVEQQLRHASLMLERSLVAA